MSIPEPSIRSTHFHGSKPLSFRVLSRDDYDSVHGTINELVKSDWRISSMLNLRHDEKMLTSNTLWIWQRRASNMERSGFLLLRKNAPCIFWNSIRDEMVSLRIQIPQGFCADGSHWLCIATICNAEQSILIEDVYIANGVQIYNTLKFAQRYSILKDAVERLSNQPYLGAQIKAVQPIGLGQWLEQTNVYGFQPDDGSVWDIQPDEIGQKRKVWVSPKKIIEGPKQINTVVLRGVDSLVYEKAVPKNHNPLIRPQTAPIARYAAIKIDKTGPDRYILEAADGKRIGYALVHGLLESERFRKEIVQGGANVARVEYVADFSKYKMVELMKKSAAEMTGLISSIGLFHEYDQ